MLDTLLSRRGSFAHAHGIGNVPDHRNSLLGRFVGNGEIRFAGNRQYLDEIHAPLFHRVHRLARVFRSIHRDGLPVALPGRQKRARHQEVRAQQFSAVDAPAPAFEHVRIAAHVTYAGHAVGNVQRVDHLFVPCWRYECAMHMHVPQSGDQVFSVGIDDLNVPARADKAHLGQSADPPFLDDEGHTLSDLAVAYAHDVYVGENEHIVRALRLRPGPEEGIAGTARRSELLSCPKLPKNTDLEI